MYVRGRHPPQRTGKHASKAVIALLDAPPWSPIWENNGVQGHGRLQQYNTCTQEAKQASSYNFSETFQLLNLETVHKLWFPRICAFQNSRYMVTDTKLAQTLEWFNYTMTSHFGSRSGTCILV